MKKRILLGLLGLLGGLTAGCHAQVPPNPTVYNCPATTGTAYTPLNQSAPATGLTYTDTKPAAGTYCYIAESVIASTGQVSVPSNTAGPLTLSGANSTLLSWTAPTSGSTPTGYVLARAAAVASTVLAPVLGTPTTAQALPQVRPALPDAAPQVAGNRVPAPVLTGSVRQP